MYRIMFDYKTARFVVQIWAYGLFWRNAQDLNYGTYNEALDAVQNIGLDKLYQDKSANAYQAYMAEGNARRLLV